MTEEGGPTSHTAIIARTMGVPAVVALPGAASLPDGTRVLVDGTAGTVRLDPSDEDVTAARAAATARSSALAEFAGPGATADGHAVPLLANIGGPKDLEAAWPTAPRASACIAPSSCSWTARRRRPTRSRRRRTGRCWRRSLKAAWSSGPSTRADKPLAFLPAPGEGRTRRSASAACGCRSGTRTSCPRSSPPWPAPPPTNAKLQVMAPMVTDAAEAAWFAAACREAGIEHPGVMIEVPAAALRARDVALEVEFFSIGTNDLTQYACAADRQVGGLAHLQDPWQPAVLDLVAPPAARASPAAYAARQPPTRPGLRPGRSGSDVVVDERPVPPLVRAALARHTLDDCRQAAAKPPARPAQPPKPEKQPVPTSQP